jgi:hypothetical protein
MPDVVLSVLSGEDARPKSDIVRRIRGILGSVDEQVWKDVVKFK